MMHKWKAKAATRINLEDPIQKAEATSRGTDPVYLSSTCLAVAEPHMPDHCDATPGDSLQPDSLFEARYNRTIRSVAVVAA